MKKCQAHKECPRPPQILLITACIEQHLNETMTCRTHLETLTTLAGENKLYCHCGKLIITGLYKHNNTIHKLNEENNQ